MSVSRGRCTCRISIPDLVGSAQIGWPPSSPTMTGQCWLRHFECQIRATHTLRVGLAATTDEAEEAVYPVFPLLFGNGSACGCASESLEENSTASPRWAIGRMGNAPHTATECHDTASGCRARQDVGLSSARSQQSETPASVVVSADETPLSEAKEAPWPSRHAHVHDARLRARFISEGI